MCLLTVIGPDHLREHRSVMRAVVVQALMPVACCLPPFTLAVLDYYDVVETSGRDANRRWWSNEIYFLFYLTPTIDATITLFVIRSYRRALFHWLATIRERIPWRGDNRIHLIANSQQ